MLRLTNMLCRPSMPAGLNSEPTSLVSQLAAGRTIEDGFSYCLDDVGHHLLVLGVPRNESGSELDFQVGRAEAGSAGKNRLESEVPATCTSHGYLSWYNGCHLLFLFTLFC